MVSQPSEKTVPSKGSTNPEIIQMQVSFDIWEFPLTPPSPPARGGGRVRRAANFMSHTRLSRASRGACPELVAGLR